MIDSCSVTIFTLLTDSTPAYDQDGLPPGVTENDLDLFKLAQEKAQQALQEVGVLFQQSLTDMLSLLAPTQRTKIITATVLVDVFHLGINVFTFVMGWIFGFHYELM